MGKLKDEVRATVLSVTEGNVTASDLDAANGELAAAGIDSLMLLALIEALEGEFGIVIDPTQSPEFLMSEDSIASFVADQLGMTVDA